FSTALTFGGDFHVRGLGISPYGQLLYSRTGFDSYEETLRAGPGSGLGLAVDSRSVTALSGIVGSRFTYTHSTNWGVLVPTAALEWQHEFKDDLQSISARFIHDPTGTLITMSGEPTDSDYLRLSVGLSLVLTHGRSGFFLYQRVLARDGQSQDDLSIGVRIEF
ncbi:MAG: autotransporter outer membrane beta-barrel domain-containing protein, partial [Arenimonas sp.]